MKLLIILFVVYVLANRRRSRSGALGVVLSMIGGIAGGIAGAIGTTRGGNGSPYVPQDRPSDDYFRGYENWERESYARELPREPGDERY